MSKLGIVGGLGPAASAYFYSMITDLTDAGCDQEHLELIIYSRPRIPNRTAYILGESAESPVPMIIDAANALAGLGAELIAIPCVTAHCFYDEIARAVNAPVINIMAETVAYLESFNIKQVGLMATDGLIAGGVFPALLAAEGIDVLLPTADDQARIMQTIDDYKAGLTQAAAPLSTFPGADAILLACTELSLLKRDMRLDGLYIDMLEILARRAIELSGGKCR